MCFFFPFQASLHLDIVYYKSTFLFFYIAYFRFRLGENFPLYEYLKNKKIYLNIFILSFQKHFQIFIYYIIYFKFIVIKKFKVQRYNLKLKDIHQSWIESYKVTLYIKMCFNFFLSLHILRTVFYNFYYILYCIFWIYIE